MQNWLQLDNLGLKRPHKDSLKTLKDAKKTLKNPKKP